MEKNTDCDRIKGTIMQKINPDFNNSTPFMDVFKSTVNTDDAKKKKKKKKKRASY